MIRPALLAITHARGRQQAESAEGTTVDHACFPRGRPKRRGLLLRRVVCLVNTAENACLPFPQPLRSLAPYDLPPPIGPRHETAITGVIEGVGPASGPS